MKKNWLTLSLLFTLGLSLAQAHEEPKVDPRVQRAFQKEFAYATNVSWITNPEFTQVRFSLFDQGLVAWYNTDAERISLARNILYAHLPMRVIQSLEEKYSSAEISDIVEVTNGDETTYYFRAEEKNRQILLKATPFGSVSVVKK